MACLRSFSRRNLYKKLLCFKNSSPFLLHHTESHSSDSSLLIRRFHKQIFFEQRSKQKSFVQPMNCGLLLCRHMSSSSKPDEDMSGNVVEETMGSAKVFAIDECGETIENFSFPEDCVQYVINGIHELTGFNWWMSIVLTSFMVSVFMSPVSLWIQIQAWKLQIWGKRVHKVISVIQTYDPKVLAKYEKGLIDLFNKLGEAVLSFMNPFVLDAFIYSSFINGISTMAKKIPGFENGGILWFTDLSTPDSFYILPLVTGFIFWFTLEIHINRKNLLSRMKRLTLFLIVFIALQATYELEPAVYFYMIPSRIYVSTLFLNVPVTTTVSEQQRIMARVISLMREFVNVLVKKKDKK